MLARPKLHLSRWRCWWISRERREKTEPLKAAEILEKKAERLLHEGVTETTRFKMEAVQLPGDAPRTHRFGAEHLERGGGW